MFTWPLNLCFIFVIRICAGLCVCVFGCLFVFPLVDVVVNWVRASLDQGILDKLENMTSCLPGCLFC